MLKILHSPRQNSRINLSHLVCLVFFFFSFQFSSCNDAWCVVYWRTLTNGQQIVPDILEGKYYTVYTYIKCSRFIFRAHWRSFVLPYSANTVTDLFTCSRTPHCPSHHTNKGQTTTEKWHVSCRLHPRNRSVKAKPKRLSSFCLQKKKRL